MNEPTLTLLCRNHEERSSAEELLEHTFLNELPNDEEDE